jgi:hypothetical protein
MVKDSHALAERLALPETDVDALTAVLAEIGESYLNFRVPATREAELRAELSITADATVEVPFFDDDVHDLSGLLGVGEALFSDQGR